MILADTCRNKLVMPEHLLLAALGDKVINDRLEETVHDLPIEEVKDQLREYIDKQEHFDEEDEERQMYASHQYGELMRLIEHSLESSTEPVADVQHLFLVMYRLKDSFAANCLKALVNEDKDRFFMRLIEVYRNLGKSSADSSDGELGEKADADEQYAPASQGDVRQATGSWRDYVLCINDHLADHNPLIGRETELDRTVQVLCRKDKNNPLHIGEPGVGKTSIV